MDLNSEVELIINSRIYSTLANKLPSRDLNVTKRSLNLSS